MNMKINFVVFLAVLGLARLVIAHDFFFSSPPGILLSSLAASCPADEEEEDSGFVSLAHELLLIKKDIRNYNLDFLDRISYLNIKRLLKEKHLKMAFHECLAKNFYAGKKMLLSVRPNFARIILPKNGSSKPINNPRQLVLFKDL